MKLLYALTALGVVALASGGTVGARPNAEKARITTTICGADIANLPSGLLPLGDDKLLFNDHHVRGAHPILVGRYADIINRYQAKHGDQGNRAVGAFACGPTVLVPLRSMFESMGATVTYDPGTKKIDVTKPNESVELVVGQPQITINGETRPLDVPAFTYKDGLIYIPLRAVSEGMGAYVTWEQPTQTVVIRYLQRPLPTIAPSETPKPAGPAFPTPLPAVPSPSATPTPAPPARNPYEHFIVGDYLFSPKVYNEFSPGNSGKGGSFAARGAVEFPAFGLPWMLEGDYRSYSYPHESGINPAIFAGLPKDQLVPCPFAARDDQGCVTVIGAYGSVVIPSFTARDTDFDGRLGLRIAEPRIYIGVGYLHREENYGYPKQSGFGFGAEKLPDLQQTISVYGSVWYYPSISGNFTYPTSFPPPVGFIDDHGDKFQQRFLKYQIGGTLNLGNSGLFLDAGFLGDTIRGKNLSPSDASHAGGYLGLGIKF